MLFCRYLVLLLLAAAGLHGQEVSTTTAERLMQGVEGLTVDLREPHFSQGVLTTSQGGVITGPNFRLQARIITYTQKVIDGQPLTFVEAEGDIMLELECNIFVGERLEYDFVSRTGVIHCGRAGVAPWYFGGQVIQLFADNSYLVKDGYITTSESNCPDWQITAEVASLHDYHFLCASHVRFKLLKTTLFWLPSLKLDLDLIDKSPIRYTLGWGGKQGPRFGVSYLIMDWERWKAYLRADVRLKRGLGVGLETHYLSCDYCESFDTINYFARDSSIFNTHELYRYRFQGAYYNSFFNDCLSVALVYDKLSDKDVPIDYADQSLDIEVAGRTQLDIRQQGENWIALSRTRLRINSFETVKQELPTIEMSWRPYVFGMTGIIGDSKIEAAYLDFAYANNVLNVHDYNATRVAFYQKFYRPLFWGPVTFTPQAGGRAIFYGNGPHRSRNWLLIGMLGFDLEAPMHRYYNNFKHVIIPYAKYEYFTYPTSPPNKHYIFDIDDGLYRLNALRLGTRHSLYTRECDGYVRRLLFADFYTYAFFNTKTIKQTIPKVYLQATYYSSLTVRHSCDIAWNFLHQQLDHFNVRTEWTLSPDLAIYLEFRHRGAYDWRKADRDNFFLESFRKESELRRSLVSDKREIALFHFYYRFHPNWAIEYESRHGWHWRDRRQFHEFEIDIRTTLRSSIQTKLSFQHKEAEDRVAIYFSVWPQGPEHPRDSYIPALEF